jgi:hypothetical protein
MPTSKPRITVTLTEEQHAILREISAAGGQSMSGVISEFRLMAQLTLERMAVALQQLKQDTDADRKRVADMLSELHAERARRGVPALSSAWPDTPLEAAERPIPTTDAEPHAIQFCASVDFVRPDTDMATGSRADIEVDPDYAKQKRSMSPTTRNSARLPKGTLKRAKK